MSYITDTKLNSRYYIGDDGHFATLTEAFTWLNLNMSMPTELLLDGVSFPINDTLVVDYPYPLAIRGISNIGTTLDSSTGLETKPMFIQLSDLALNKLSINGYTTNNFVDVSSLTYTYSDFQDIIVDGFNEQIKITGENELFLFNSIMQNANTCSVCVDSSLDVAIDVEVVSFINNKNSIDLRSTSEGKFSIMNNLFDIDISTYTAIKYEPSTYILSPHNNISGNRWSNIGTFLTGFDFSRSDGRDANVYVNSNSGQEDKTPHMFFNAYSTTAPDTSIFTITTWTKARLQTTIDTFYTCKLAYVSDNKVTMLSENEADLRINVTGNIETDAGATALLGISIFKNASTNANNELVTGELISFGRVVARTNDDAYPFSMVGYVDDFEKDDYLEIFVRSNKINNVRISNLSGLIG